jgi:hypothetical protein
MSGLLGSCWPGVARRQVTFFCFAAYLMSEPAEAYSLKATKEKATLHPRIPRSLPTTCRVSGFNRPRRFQSKKLFVQSGVFHDGGSDYEMLNSLASRKNSQ